MSSTTTLARRTTSAALLVAVLAAGASAKDAASNPVPAYLQALDVAPGVEHRLVVLHPILAQPRPVKRGDEVALGGLATPDVLAFGKMERSASPRVEALSFSAGPAVLLSGDVLRTDTADFAVLRDVVVDGGKPLTTQLVRVSREVAPDAKIVESVTLGPVLPSAIRFLLLDDTPAVDIREVCARWAEEVRLTTDRLSPVELQTAESIKKRVADYRRSFAGVFKRTPTGGREIVGCAVLVDGAFASFETFADGKSFAAAWPRLLDGIATEAAVLEAHGRLLETDIPDPADPDRFLSDMKHRLLAVYGARPVERAVRASGRSLEFSADAALARALIVGEDQIVHFVLVTDPARRGEKRSSDGPDLNAAERKLRQTEAEKRELERRNGGSAAPQPPEPPPPPPTPK
jgi:hypothetical protein